MGPDKEGGGEVEYVGWKLSGEKREGGIGVGGSQGWVLFPY